MRKTRITLADVVTSQEKYNINRISRENGRFVAGNLFSYLKEEALSRNRLIQVDGRGYIKGVRVKVGEGWKWMRPYVKGFDLFLVDESCQINICSYDIKTGLIL